MVDLSKLRGATKATLPTDPVRLFERAPKPEGVNDLWKSQDAVLRLWNERRGERDVVLKLNTGGGKTLVGLLIAQSKMNERKVGALYLCANNQLVDQTVAKAGAFQLPAIRYDAGPGRPLPAAFENGEAILVATYRALFHGYSKFKVRGRGNPVEASVIICDDAHTAFSDVRDAFSVVITRKKSEALYKQVTSRLRPAAEAVHRLGSFDHRVGGQDLGVFEVPYWEWSKVAHEVRDLITKFAENSEYQFQLPLISDQFERAHVLVRSTDITITPLLPPIDQIPTFYNCRHRVFMSATIADDSALVRTFDASAEAVRDPIAPGGLAGVGERMILSPALTPIGPKDELATARLLAKAVSERGMGVVVLSPSESSAKGRWAKFAKIVQKEEVAGAVDRLNDRSTGDNGPYVLVNRYDGVDLPKDACRLLVMDGLPRGFNAYDEFRAVALGGSSQIELGLAQRVEQGIGRGTRGAGDYCVVLLLDVAQDWVSRRSNVSLMTPGTRAQINLGLELSKTVTDVEDIQRTVDMCLNRDSEWISVHASQLAERTASEAIDRSVAELALESAIIERAFFKRYLAGELRAARELADEVAGKHSEDRLFRGWVLQLAARAAFAEHANRWTEEGLERQAGAAKANSHLFAPPGRPVSIAVPLIASQASRVAAHAGSYERPAAYVAAFDRIALSLTGTVPAGEFEEAMRVLGYFLGLVSERLDHNGEGPDITWRTADRRIVVISCKNEKGTEKPLSKKDLGQLLIDAHWIEERFEDHQKILLMAHPSPESEPGVPTSGVRVLTIGGLSDLVGAVRHLVVGVANAGVADVEREARAEELLKKYDLSLAALLMKYTTVFRTRLPKGKRER